MIASGGNIASIDGRCAGDLSFVDVAHGSHIELIFAVGQCRNERVIAIWPTDAAFVDELRIGGLFAQYVPCLFDFYAAWELSRRDPVLFAVVAAHEWDVWQYIESARRPARPDAFAIG